MSSSAFGYVRRSWKKQTIRAEVSRSYVEEEKEEEEEEDEEEKQEKIGNSVVEPRMSWLGESSALSPLSLSEGEAHSMESYGRCPNGETAEGFPHCSPSK